MRLYKFHIIILITIFCVLPLMINAQALNILYKMDFNGTNTLNLSNTGVNQWVKGTAAGDASYPDDGNALYISNNGSAYSYSTASAVVANYAYTNAISSGAGLTDIALAFCHKVKGESGYDYLNVYVQETIYAVPTAGSTTVSNGTLLGTFYSNTLSDWMYSLIHLPAATWAGKTFRIIFQWRNDNTTGTQPPAAIDCIRIYTTTTTANVWLGGEFNWEDVSKPENWSLGHVPNSSTEDLIIPKINITGYGVNCACTNSSSMTCRDLTVEDGAWLSTYDNVGNRVLKVYGDLNIYGWLDAFRFISPDFYLSRYMSLILVGGTSGSYKSINLGSNADVDLAHFQVGDLSTPGYYKINQHTYVFGVSAFYGSLDMNNYDLGAWQLSNESSASLLQRSGFLLIGGDNTWCYLKSGFDAGTGITCFWPYWTGSVYYESLPPLSLLCNQTIPTLPDDSKTYYNLWVGTNNGYTATIGTTGLVPVRNELYVYGVDGGTATFAQVADVKNNGAVYFSDDPTDANLTVNINSGKWIATGGNMYIGNTTNTVTMNVAGQVYASGTLTMADNDNHIINITYADATNKAFMNFTGGRFYGTVNYNNSVATKQILSNYITTYKNLTISGAGTGIRELSSSIIADGNVTLTSGGALTAGNYNLNVAGNWTNNISSTGFAAGTSTVTFDGNKNSIVAGNYATTFNHITVNKGATYSAAWSGAKQLLVDGNLLVSGGICDVSYTDNIYSFVKGNVTINPLCTLNHNISWSGSNGIEVRGNWTCNGYYNPNSKSLIHMNGNGSASSFAITSNASSPFWYLVLTHTGAGSMNLGSDVYVDADCWAGWDGTCKFNIGGNKLTVGGSFNVGGYASTVNVFNNSAILDLNRLSIYNGATLTCKNGATNYTPNIYVAGNWRNHVGSTFIPGQSTITFDGNAEQRINITEAVDNQTPFNADFNLYNLVIDGANVKFYYNKNTYKFNVQNNLIINNGKVLNLFGL